jgi:monothiol glutaredoxin
MSLDPQLKQRIDEMVASSDVVLFMKGTRNFPQCGFSATVVQILNGLVDEYTTVNVLSDPAIRQGIKDYSSWPTIPQLYVNGEFVGGCDIVREMYASGDLASTLGVDVGDVEPPTISITEAAAGKLKEALEQADDGDYVHLAVSNRFEHQMELGPKGKIDLEVDAGPIVVLIDPISAKRANGLTIDFVDRGLGGAGFKIDNPNAPADVEQITPKNLKAKLDAGEIEELFDVRTPKERETANIGGRLLDDDAMSYIEALPKETPIAFYCHTGRRSNSAAEHFRDKGFTKLYNLAGGIDAWSVEVDPTIPRY